MINDPTLDLLNRRFLDAFQEVGIKDAAPVIQRSSRAEFGDYQVNGIMKAAKNAHCSPKELAAKVVEVVVIKDMAEKIEIAGPGFINIHLSDSYLAQKVNLALDPAQAKKGRSKRRVMVEYASVNLAKEMHVGHLRGAIIGDALARVRRYLGDEVILQSHVGDWGTQFGMLLAYLEQASQSGIAEFELADLNRFYQKAKAEFDASPSFAIKARDLVVKLQNGDAEVIRYWRDFVTISLAHCNTIFRRLGLLLSVEDVRGESFYNDDLPLIIDDLANKGLLSIEDNTKLVFLNEFKSREGNASGFIVQKSDGGYLYATTDLGAIRFRVGHLKLQECLYVVDIRQSLHFEQLFTVARKAGYLSEDADFRHVSHGTIMGENRKPLKTKSGESVKLDALLEEATERALVLVSGKNFALTEQSRKRIAEVVGIGALKYADLSRNRNTDYVFDWDSMLSFEGNTAPYLQYAYTRAFKISSKLCEIEGHNREIMHSHEHDLAVELTRFHDIVNLVALENQPHLLCTYLHSVAVAFSRFYESCPVVKENRADALRMNLSKFAAQVLSVGLALLGIEVLSEM